MSDVMVTPASFQGAYRPYAPEQGQDPALGKVKAAEVANQTVSVADTAGAMAVDTVYISADASRMYAESLRRQKTVVREERTRDMAGDEGTTARTRQERRGLTAKRRR